MTEGISNFQNEETFKNIGDEDIITISWVLFHQTT